MISNRRQSSRIARNSNNDGEEGNLKDGDIKGNGNSAPSGKEKDRKKTPTARASTPLCNRSTRAKVQSQLFTELKLADGKKPNQRNRNARRGKEEESKGASMGKQQEAKGTGAEEEKTEVESVQSNLSEGNSKKPNVNANQEKDGNEEEEVNDSTDGQKEESTQEGSSKSEGDDSEMGVAKEEEQKAETEEDEESGNEDDSTEGEGDETDKKRKNEKDDSDSEKKDQENEKSDEITYYNYLTNSPPTKFKKVDCYSSKRRECVKVKSIRERSSTPEKSNKSKYRNNFYSRITVKITLPPSTKPHETFCSTMRELFKELFQADETTQILPWKKLSTSTVLGVQSDLPQSITGMTKYCFRAYTPKEGVPATIYPQLFIGHDVEFDDLREALQPWLDSKLFGIYYNMLQAEDPKDIGWLLYSTREIDTGALADEITDMIGADIGLRWKNIPTGAKTTQDNMVKALIVESSARMKWKVQSDLLDLYSRAIKPPRAYPNSIRLRFVKFKKDAFNKEEKSKIDKLRNRQKQFLEGIKQYISNDILQLDYSANPGNEPTLRQMILELKHSETGNPLFHTVDMDWRQDGFIFQYSGQHADEAESTVHTLITVLEHYHPEVDVASNFSEEAVENSYDMRWDEAKKCAVDSRYNESSEFLKEEELPGFVFEQEALAELNRAVDRIAMPNESDSVSTFRQQKDPTKNINQQRNPPSAASNESNRASSTASIGTSLTNESYATLDSRISGLASQMMTNQSKTDQQMKKQQDQFNIILEKLQSLEQNNSNNSTSKDASSPKQTGNSS